MGARQRGGIGFSYRPAKLYRLAEFIPWNQFWGPITFKSTGSVHTVCGGGRLVTQQADKLFE
jgi:hypothetical protein